MRTRQRSSLQRYGMGLVVLTSLVMASSMGFATAARWRAQLPGPGGPRQVLRTERPAAPGRELLFVPRR